MAIKYLVVVILSSFALMPGAGQNNIGNAVSESANPATVTFAINRPVTLGSRNVNGRFPLLRVSVNGREGLFLLDTGSNRTVFSDDFAKTLKVSSTGHVSGDDSGGHIVSGSILPPVRLQSQGKSSVSLNQPLAIDLPPLEALGLAGVISPQSLLDTGCVILDFTADVMTLERNGEGGCKQAVELANYRAVSLSPKGIGRPMVSALLQSGDSRVELPALLDTGAAMTSIIKEYAALTTKLAEVDTVGVAGIARTSSTVGPVTINIGNHSTTVDKVRVEEKSKEGSKLGMDVLEKSIVVLQADGTVSLAFPDSVETE